MKPRTQPRKHAKQDRSRAMVDAILKGAARVLRSEGYDRASTNRIAEAAGVSVGSLYQYFPTKEAIVSELYERHAETMFAVIEHEFSRLQNAPLDQAITHLVSLFMEATLVDPKLRRVFVEQVPRIGKMDKRQAVETRVMGLAKRLFEAHGVRSDNLELTALVVVNTVAALTYEAAMNPRFENAELIAEVSAMVTRHLRP